MARNKPAMASAAPQLEPPRAACTWDGCTSRAHLRAEIEPGKGLHNLCEFHYVEACHRVSARRVRNELGLETVEEMKAYIRKNVENVFKQKPDGVRHWTKVWNEKPPVGSIAYRTAKEFLEKRGLLPSEREPGQDDEEKSNPVRNTP